MYKLVSVDMDGTLLNSKGEISSENLTAIKEAISKGVKVVITTGRGIKSIEKFIEEIGLRNENEYVITNNGVSIHSTKTLKCINATTIESEDIKKLCLFGIESGAYIHMYDYNTESCYVLEENNYTKFERDYVGMPTFIDPNFYENINKNEKAFKVLYFGVKEKMDELYNNMPEFIKNKFAIVRSLPIAIEIFSKECNKGNAVRDLAKRFNITMDQVISIGDQNNDFEMIKFAGLGIAMGNAVDRIKNVADYITDTNDNNGVAKVINKFILKV